MNFDDLRKKLFADVQSAIDSKLDPEQNKDLSYTTFQECYFNFQLDESKTKTIDKFKAYTKQDMKKNASKIGEIYNFISDKSNDFDEQIIETYDSELQSFIAEQLKDITNNSATIKLLKDQAPIKDIVNNVIKTKQKTIDDPAVYLTFVDKLELKKIYNDQVQGFIKTSFENRNHELLSGYIHYGTASNEIKTLYDQLFTEELEKTYDEMKLINKDFIGVYTKNFNENFSDEFIKYIFICIIFFSLLGLL